MFASPLGHQGLTPGDCEQKTRARSSVSIIPKNPPPPICPKCGKPMHFIITKFGGRKFQCVKCDEVDPMRLSDVQALIASELQPPKPQ